MKASQHEDEHDHVFEDAKEHGWHSRGHSRIPSNWDIVSPPAPLGHRHSSALGDYLSACHHQPKVVNENDDSPMTSPTTHDKHTHTVKVDTPGGHTHAIHTRTPSHGHGHKKQNSRGGGGGLSRQPSALASGESTTCHVRVAGTCIVSPQEQIDEVRAGLETWESDRMSDEDICRFIRASNKDTAHAIKRIQFTLAWRVAEKPESMLCAACLKDPHSHYMHLSGYDKLNRPIIYACMACAQNNTVDGNRQHMIQTFEEAIALMPPGVERWCWITDFHGFGLKDMNPGIAKAFLALAGNHYPERLGLKIVLDAPALFSGFWSVVSPFVDPVSKKKMVFLPYKPDMLRVRLTEYFDDEYIEWLLAEAAENRQKKLVKTKTYRTPEAGCVPAEGHDCRGTKSFLQRVRELGLRGFGHLRK